MNPYQDLLTDTVGGSVLLLTLNRSDARNALRNNTLRELAAALAQAEQDSAVRVVVITGGPKVFAAGADIKEMAQLDAIGALTDPRPQYWKAIASFSKPLIAAVNGYALGGGCELMMHADIAIAGAGARFGQPEINLGTMPGAGGTQRLIRTVGKPLAMKMVLSGEMLDAAGALAAGLIAEVTADEQTIERALALATTIAAKSPLAVRMAKEALLKSFEMGLDAGLNLERKSFSLLAASADRQEGIAAFLDKRQPVFAGN
ncbi:enoyl-CoA hydratase-related protein [Paraherbaspirillum soli]|uniref:Enoyl-CoA hydratase-related protein n=1 Tax=Paraherbaspirillum soli TaxID=631222 RepID=A0ABW0MC72_9BURK